MQGKLFLVPTPIGNLGDMTYRAVEVLKNVDYILAEDTRTSGVLLKHYAIATPCKSYHMHNEHSQTENIIEEVINGKCIAMISDAGTPGVSDPGFLLARTAIQAGIAIDALPGATAVIPALNLSGLPINEFAFYGFLPVKKGRKTKFEQLQKEIKTMVFYESPHKIERTLKDCCLYFGENRKASLSRELTKKFEESIRGTLGEIYHEIQHKKRKGEMVLVIEGLKA